MDISEFSFANADEFYGFICGIISQDHDIELIFIPWFLVYGREGDGLGFTEEELLELQLVLLDNPKMGPVMKETGGLRKMRYAFEERGKSGSVRILYIDYEEHERILLLNLFTKDEKENLTKGERNQIRKAMKALEQELFGEKRNE